jgi:hypothetical protein
MARYRCAILDDYQNVVLKVTDWSKVSGDIDIKVFNEHLGSLENVAKTLQGFGIVCAMRDAPLPARRDRSCRTSSCWSRPACAMPRSTSRRPRGAASWSAAPRRWATRPPASPSA